MLDQNDECYFNVSGALVHGPCVGSFDYQNDIYALAFIEANKNVINYNHSYRNALAQADEACPYAEYGREWMQFPPVEHQPAHHADNATAEECGLWNSAYNEAHGSNP
jgi:carboxypeptidase D